MRLLAAIFAFVSMALATLGLLVLPRLPPNWIPWKAPILDAPPAWAAHLQINRLKGDRAACLDTLEAASRMTFSSEPDRSMGENCAYNNVVRMSKAPVPYNYQPVATCALTAALYWWQRDLEAAAEVLLQTQLVRIEQLGTFACRNVNSENNRGRSQHASANAIDIAAFVFKDGRRVSVLNNWRGEGSEAAFLRAARKAACRYFNGVLSPDYNAQHANHFHLDLGPYLICR